MVAISLEEQLLPGSFESALNYIIDNELDLSDFDEFYHNDTAGPEAYPPQTLLKVVLYAYSKGLLSSRKIETACRTNVVFMALAADARPDHATIASFVSTKGTPMKKVFVQVLAICSRLELIGMEQFAMDGCKLSSNAAKQRSGTFEEYRNKLAALDQKIELLMKQHQHNDIAPEQDRLQKAIEGIQKQKKRIEEFLETHTPRMHHGGREVKSNLTDSKHQIVLNAYAIGRQYEGDELHPFSPPASTPSGRRAFPRSSFAPLRFWQTPTTSPRTTAASCLRLRRWPR